MNQVGNHNYSHSVNMEKGQKGHDHLATLSKNGPESIALSLQGDDITVRQDGRLRESSGSSRVRECSNIFLRINVHLRGLGGICVD